MTTRLFCRGWFAALLTALLIAAFAGLTFTKATFAQAPAAEAHEVLDITLHGEAVQ
jgi:hypothetical protein